MSSVALVTSVIDPKELLLDIPIIFLCIRRIILEILLKTEPFQARVSFDFIFFLITQHFSGLSLVFFVVGDELFVLLLGYGFICFDSAVFVEIVH